MFNKLFTQLQVWWKTDTQFNMTAHHAAWVLAAVIMTEACIFTVGYYWGKRSGAQQLCATISRDAFADQIYNSLCMATAGLEADKSDEESDEAENSDADSTASDDSDNSESVAQNDNQAENALEVTPQFFAQLAGFTSFKKAEAFVCRLQKRQIPVLIKERISKTSRGRSLTWYQVVTEPYEDQDALNSVVAILKKEEKLHDVRIVQG
jgi:hypothetical protein